MISQGHSQKSRKRSQSLYFRLGKSCSLGGCTTGDEGKESCILLFAPIGTQIRISGRVACWLRPFIPSCLNFHLILACSSHQNQVNRCNRSPAGMTEIWNIPTSASVPGAKICRTSRTRIFGVYLKHTALRETIPESRDEHHCIIVVIILYLPLSLLSRMIGHNRCKTHHPRWFTFGYGIENIWNINECWSYIVKGTYEKQTACNSNVSEKGSQKPSIKGGHHSTGFVATWKPGSLGEIRHGFENTQEVECWSGCIAAVATSEIQFLCSLSKR